jgi:hypothetical protein
LQDTSDMFLTSLYLPAINCLLYTSLFNLPSLPAYLPAILAPLI